MRQILSKRNVSIRIALLNNRLFIDYYRFSFFNIILLLTLVSISINPFNLSEKKKKK